MFREALFIARKDAQYLVRGWEALLWLFVMPVIFFYFIGTVTGGFGGSQGARPERLGLQVGENGGFLVDQVIKRLEQNGYNVVRIDSGLAAASYARRLSIPENFTDSVLAGTQVKVKFARSESGLGQDYDNIKVGRAIYTVLADVVAATEISAQPNLESFELLENMERTLTLEVQTAGERETIPTGFEQAIPGIMVMFTMIVLLTSGAVTLVIERRQGLMRRLASTPIPRSAILAGKWAGRLVLGLIQISFAMLAGTIIFSMDWGPDLPMIFAVMFGWGSLCASLGLLLGNLARTEGQAVAIGVLSSNALAALGGCWWPIEITPGWMQAFAKFLPTGWAMDALHKLISFQAGPASAVPHVLVMLVATVVVGWMGIKKFKFQ